eukprot:Platyproteum_vivax@DN371_c0_g2_i1.p1
MANATGRKYSAVVAPGDHWVHWPDRWFEPFLNEHKMKYERMKRTRAVWRGQKWRATDVTGAMVTPGWRNANVQLHSRGPGGWRSPLEKWAKFKYYAWRSSKQLAELDLESFRVAPESDRLRQTMPNLLMPSTVVDAALQSTTTGLPQDTIDPAEVRMGLVMEQRRNRSQTK